MQAISPLRYRFREGALDHIMRTRNLHTDEQLATALNVGRGDLQRLRSGAAVSARLALRVSALQGDTHYLGGLFEVVDDRVAA